MSKVASMLQEQPIQREKIRLLLSTIVQDDNALVAYEILQLNCEVLKDRVRQLNSAKECPSDLLSTVSTIIWSSTYVDIPELECIRKQFKHKYGTKFDECIFRHGKTYDPVNGFGPLNERVVTKLACTEQPPTIILQAYLDRICSLHHIDTSITLLSEEELPCEKKLCNDERIAKQFQPVNLQRAVSLAYTFSSHANDSMSCDDNSLNYENSENWLVNDHEMLLEVSSDDDLLMAQAPTYLLSKHNSVFISRTMQNIIEGTGNALTYESFPLGTSKMNVSVDDDDATIPIDEDLESDNKIHEVTLKYNTKRSNTIYDRSVSSLSLTSYSDDESEDDLLGYDEFVMGLGDASISTETDSVSFTHSKYDPMILKSPSSRRTVHDGISHLNNMI